MANKSRNFAGGATVVLHDVELDGADGLLAFIDHDFDLDELLVQFANGHAGFLAGEDSDFRCGDLNRIVGIGYVGNFKYDRVDFCGGTRLVCFSGAVGFDGKMATS